MRHHRGLHDSRPSQMCQQINTLHQLHCPIPLRFPCSLLPSPPVCPQHAPPASPLRFHHQSEIEFSSAFGSHHCLSLATAGLPLRLFSQLPQLTHQLAVRAGGSSVGSFCWQLFLAGFCWCLALAAAILASGLNFGLQ